MKDYRSNKCYPPDLLESEIKKYFELKEVLDEIATEKGIKIIHKPKTLSGLAVYLGVSRQTLENYAKDEAYKEMLTNAKERCCDELIAFSLVGKYNATTAIFELKNNHGYKDKQEIVSDNISKIEITRKEIKSKDELSDD